MRTKVRLVIKHKQNTCWNKLGKKITRNFKENQKLIYRIKKEKPTQLDEYKR